MKIKIPFTNKQVILDPLYEGLFFMLCIYAVFSITILLFVALGAKVLFGIIGAFILVHIFKTSSVEEVEDSNVKE